MAGVTLKKEPLPATITHDWLIKQGACEQAEFFRETYPEGTKITEEVVDVLLEEGIDLEFLVGAAYNIYEDGFQDHLHKKTSRAFKSYEEAMELLYSLQESTHKAFLRGRIAALCEITRSEDLPTQEGEQYRLTFLDI